jgi:DNA-binding response OmpR family regulator
MPCQSHDGGVHRLLLIEDDLAIAEPFARALHHDGHQVEVAGDSPTRLQRALTGGHDLVVLMLTARAEETDAVVGLDAGADDYLIEPDGGRLELVQARPPLLELYLVADQG